MTDTLYLRRARVQVADVVVSYDSDTSLRIRFKVVKNPWATVPNKAHIDVFNLSDERRSALDTLIAKRVSAAVTIEAGYAGALSLGIAGRIFKGRLLSVAHSRERGDWITKIVGSSFSARDVAISATYSPPNLNVGTIAADLLRKIARAAGDVDVSQAVARALDGDLSGLEQTLNRAFSVNGMGMDVLERLVANHGFRVSEQDGKITLLKTNEKLGTAIVLDSNSGLVGPIDPITDVRRPGVYIIRARSLLRHDIQIGTAIQLAGVAQRGLFVAEQVEHHGDTHGGGDAFITAFHGRALRGKNATAISEEGE